MMQSNMVFQYFWPGSVCMHVRYVYAFNLIGCVVQYGKDELSGVFSRGEEKMITQSFGFDSRMSLVDRRVRLDVFTCMSWMI